MNDTFGTPITPLDTPRKNNNKTIMIIVAVVAFLLICCCCLFAAAAWQFGDQILSSLGIYY